VQVDPVYGEAQRVQVLGLSQVLQLSIQAVQVKGPLEEKYPGTVQVLHNDPS
jgi:hypothetical protein